MATQTESTPRYFTAVQAIVKGIKVGSMTFVLPDGRRFESTGDKPGPAGEIVVRNNDVFGRIIRDGDLGFAEAHGIAGSGRGSTWPVHLWLHWIPGIRIDHVFLGPGLTSTSAWTGGLTGSDHRPSGCVVTLAQD